MSDYLGHLLERSFAQAPKLRPQSPALFEPPPSTHMVERPTDFDQSTNVETTAPALPANDRSRTLSTARSVPPAADHSEKKTSQPGAGNISSAGALQPNNRHAPRAITEETEAMPTVTNSSAVTAGPLEPETKKSFKPTGPTEHAPTGASGKTTAISPALPANFTPLETNTRTFSDSGSAPIRESKNISPAAQPRFTSPPPTLSAKRSAGEESTGEERSTPPPGIRPRSVVVATRIPVPAGNPERARRVTINHGAPASGRMHNHHGSAETTPPSLPSIQVTIGRVEVRATSLPAPTRAPARKDSGMSLDAYLQRRAEGGRQ